MEVCVLFLAVSWVGLQSVVVAVPGQTHWHFPRVYLRKHVIPQFNLESYDPLMRLWKGFRDIYQTIQNIFWDMVKQNFLNLDKVW